jgi:hypothetical protein
MPCLLPSIRGWPRSIRIVPTTSDLTHVADAIHDEGLTHPRPSKLTSPNRRWWPDVLKLYENPATTGKKFTSRWFAEQLVMTYNADGDSGYDIATRFRRARMIILCGQRCLSSRPI